MNLNDKKQNPMRCSASGFKQLCIALIGFVNLTLTGMAIISIIQFFGGK